MLSMLFGIALDLPTFIVFQKPTDWLGVLLGIVLFVKPMTCDAFALPLISISIWYVSWHYP